MKTDTPVDADAGVSFFVSQFVLAGESRTHYGSTYKIFPSALRSFLTGDSLPANSHFADEKILRQELQSTCQIENFYEVQSRKSQIYCRISRFEAKQFGKFSFVRRDGFDSRQPMYCEDRNKFECYPSFNSIGKVLKISINTVRKYVSGLENKGLITTKHTKILTKDGQKQNGNLLYKIRPMREVLSNYYGQQMIRFSG